MVGRPSAHLNESIIDDAVHPDPQPEVGCGGEAFSQGVEHGDASLRVHAYAIVKVECQCLLDINIAF